MRCSPIVVALALASPAHAELRVLVAADSYLATTPGYTSDSAADTALAAHVELRDPDRDVIFDGVDRESLIGGAARRELHELAYVERGVPGLELTLGRFRVPGGFWLIADGAEVALRSGALTAGVFGGSRAFTNARADTLLTAHPAPLPLVGAAITARGAVQAALSYSYTADRVVIPRGDGVAFTQREPEQFLDAELSTPLGDHGFLTFGANAGSRYLVTYPSTPSAAIVADPTLDNLWFASQAAYALLDWKLGAWRLDLTAAALRTKLEQSDVPADGDVPLSAITGSFAEATARAGYRPDRALRIDGRYRLRLWADGGRAQRGQVDAAWRRGALELQARIGVDLHHDRAPAPGLVDSRSVFYQASVGHKTQTTEIAVGAAAVSAIGDELAFGPGDDPGDQRAPYTLEARSYGFVRAFGSLGSWFGGLDGEIDLHGEGIRALLQIGYGR